MEQITNIQALQELCRANKKCGFYIQLSPVEFSYLSIHNAVPFLDLNSPVALQGGGYILFDSMAELDAAFNAIESTEDMDVYAITCNQYGELLDEKDY